MKTTGRFKTIVIIALAWFAGALLLDKTYSTGFKAGVTFGYEQGVIRGFEQGRSAPKMVNPIWYDSPQPLKVK